VDVVRVLEQFVELHGRPVAIKSDNGAGFVAKRVQERIKERGIGARYIEPGSLWQNGHNESFSGVFRDGCLNRWIFESLRHVREASESWLYEYDEERAHGSLGGLTPMEFIDRWGK
jgi:putative transposase